MQPVEPGAGAAERAEEAAAAAVCARPAVADVAALAAEDDGLRREGRIVFEERAKESETNVISGLSAVPINNRRWERERESA